MSTSPTWERTRQKLLTLLVINIFQPVRLSVLTRHLSPYVKRAELSQIINELVLQGKVAKEANFYRLTANGLESIVPGKGRFLRDIHRMEYLVSYARQRGGSTSDDASSSVM